MDELLNKDDSFLDDLWEKEAPDVLPEVVVEEPNAHLFDRGQLEQTVFQFDTDVSYSRYGKEFRVYGPPGTGKTEYVRRSVEYWKAKHPLAKVMLISMTRSAGAGLASRVILQKSDFAGTLHSACHRLFGRPTLAELKVQEFNARYPRYALSKPRNLLTGEDGDETTAGKQPGDGLREVMMLYRTKMIPRREWDRAILPFVEHYEEWKKENRYVDFTDLLEMALEQTVHAPGDPNLILGDEAQDWGRLPLTLVRKWGNAPGVDKFTLVGDSDQSLYRFTGADPEDFFGSELPPQRITVLEQSYRVPKIPLDLALPWIQKIKNRPNVVYRPRLEYKNGPVALGAVRRLRATYESPEKAIEYAWKTVQRGQSVGLMFSCAYMARKSIDIMRVNRMPFSNPFRASAAEWNPMPFGNSKRVMSSDRVLAFLRPDPQVWGDEARLWTGEELARWCEYLYADGVTLPKMKGKVEALKGNHNISRHADRAEKAAGLFEISDDPANSIILEHYLTPQALAASESGDLQWLRSALTSSRGNAMLYPIEVALRHGAKILREKPKLWIGTIHSFKGHQFDTAILFPDLSDNFYNQWTGNQTERDDSRRLAYVAMTRCINELIICDAARTKSWKLL